MQKLPESLSFGQLVLVLAGHSTTSGGSSETELKDWAAKPAGSPSRQPVAITTPVQNCPMVSRNTRWSISDIPLPWDRRAADYNLPLLPWPTSPFPLEFRVRQIGRSRGSDSGDRS